MKNFEQISTHPGFIKHNSGLLFRVLSGDEYEFKTTINENHLNKAQITHGGYVAAIIDAGIGTAVHKATKNNIYVTISLNIKFIDSTKVGDEIIGKIKIDKITNSLVFASCILNCQNNLIASGSGVWKKTSLKFK